MTDTVKQILGTYIADDQAAKPSVLAWLQEQLRAGELKGLVAMFAKSQPEPIDPSLVLVDAVTPDGIECRFPFCLFDHESPSALRSELRATLQPLPEPRIVRVEPPATSA